MSEREDDIAPESVQGDELEPVSLQDLRSALGPGATPATSSPRPVDSPAPAPVKAAPARPATRPLAPRTAPTAPKPLSPLTKPASVAATTTTATAKVAPKPPPRPPRPPLRSVPDTGRDMSAKDLEAFAAMSGSSTPPPPETTAPVLAGAAAVPRVPEGHDAAPPRVRHALPKAPPRKALSSQTDEAELARRDPITSTASDASESTWQRPPDSGLQDLRQLASLSTPPGRGSAPDDVLTPEALAAPLLPPDLRVLSQDVVEPGGAAPEARPVRPKETNAPRSRRATSTAPSASTSSAPRKSAPPAPEPARSRAGLIALAAVAIVGGGTWLATREPSSPTDASRPSATAPIEPGTPTPDTSGVGERPPQAPTAEATPAEPATAEPTTTTTPTSDKRKPTDVPKEPRPSTTSEVAATPTSKPTAKPTSTPGGSGEFDKAAASAALSGAVGAASGCKQPGDPSGVARVQVTFAPSGRATTANLSGPPFAGTPTGSCIARAFRSATVPPFSGDPVTVSKTVTIP